jgi:hypothetical protein
MARSSSPHRLFDLVMLVILAGLAFGFARCLWQIPQQHDSLPPSVIMIGIGFGIWFAVWRGARTKRTGPVCAECGRRFDPHGQLVNSNLCARCRQASLPRAQSGREQRVTWLGIVFGLTILMAVFGVPFWNPLVARFGGFSWALYPLLALGATLGLLVAIFLVLLTVNVVRNWRMRFEKPTLALARKSAGDEGTIARTGPVTIWWSGPTDPVPMVTEQMEIVRQRFERLVDEPVEAPPLRVLVFDKRRAFVAYHRNTVADRSLFDCLYAGRPVYSLSLSTEPARLRLADPSKSMRTGLVLYLLESFKGYHPAYWLQSGISSHLSTDQGADAREHLKRRMKVSLANGAALRAAELTSKLTPLRTREQLGSLVDHSSFARVMQRRGQSWSVIEYLAGAEAPAERLGRFRSFLSDLSRATSQEETFARHFGHGFDTLVEEWQAWVKQKALGSDAVPPSDIRTAIMEMLVPAIRDRSKKAQDRIQAMRSMGATGYALGADTLIDGLREGDDRFTETATWALESISGLAYGSDPARWSEWWASRDPKVISEFEFAEIR